MSWSIFVVDKPSGGRALVGEAHYAHHLIQNLKPGQNSVWLSRQYMEQWFGKRPPIVVALPLGNCVYHFCVDGPYRSRGESNPNFDGWDVTGDLPNITVSPSIDMSASHGWHGFIKNGVVGDDVSGIKFDDRGILIPR